jgi:hypothetical protein
LAGGIGFASAEHEGNLRYYPDPTFNFNVKNTVNGNYFSARLKGGIQLIIQNAVIEVAAGYRIANAGELKGEHLENGDSFENMPVRDINGNGIEFDFSGTILTVGIAILI